MPNASGTLALTSDLTAYVTLATTQTISGLKTFTALATNNEAVGIKLTSGVVSTGGYLTLNSKVVGTLLSLILAPDSTTNRAEFTFDNTALRTYALPNTSGTLALTSNLSAYLPLSGGTLTGPLSGTSATFNGQVIITNNNSLTLAGLGLNSINLSVGTVGGISGLHIGVTSPFLSISESTGAATFSSTITSGSITANTGNRTLTFDNITNYGQSLVINSAGSLPLLLQTNGTTALTINSSQNVGIGTSSPGANLEVVSTIRATNNASTGFAASSLQLFAHNGSSVAYGGGIFQTNSTFAYQQIAANQTNIYGFASGGMRIATGNAPIIFGTGNADLDFSTERMRITSGGKVNITGGSDDYTMTVVNSRSAAYGMYIQAGNGSTYTAIEAFNYNASTNIFRLTGAGVLYAQNTTIQAISDVRTKENIVDSKDGLDIINALRPVRFDFKEGFGFERKNQLGFIAQEVEKVFPDIVDEWKFKPEDEITYKTVGPSGLIPVLVKAIQELEARIKELENK
jgi:hypothetical protein